MCKYKKHKSLSKLIKSNMAYTKHTLAVLPCTSYFPAKFSHNPPLLIPRLASTILPIKSLFQIQLARVFKHNFERISELARWRNLVRSWWQFYCWRC